MSEKKEILYCLYVRVKGDGNKWQQTNYLVSSPYGELTWHYLGCIAQYPENFGISWQDRKKFGLEFGFASQDSETVSPLDLNNFFSAALRRENIPGVS